MDTHDIAFDNELFNSAQKYNVISEAFFRDNDNIEVDQLYRYTHGGLKFIKFNWNMEFTDADDKFVEEIVISNDSESILPTNSFALIGNNEVGKTSLLKDIVLAANNLVMRVPSIFIPDGKLRMSADDLIDEDTVKEIKKLVFITFSTFDTFSDEFSNIFEKNKNFKFIGNRQSKNLNSLIDSKKISTQLEIDCDNPFMVVR